MKNSIFLKIITKNKFNILLEMLVVLSIILSFVAVSRYYDTFFFTTKSGFRVFATFVAVSPIIAGYFAFRILFNRNFSGIIVLLIYIAINFANSIKQSLTSDVLTFYDFNFARNISIIVEYIKPAYLLNIGILVILIALMFRFKIFKLSNIRKIPLLVKLTGIAVILPFSIHPYIFLNDFVGFDVFKDIFNKYGVKYVAWSMSENILQNGLPIHLVQTSVRQIPKKYKGEEDKLFDSLSTNKDGQNNRPMHIFFILLESAWCDEKNFKNIFEPLKKRGFVDLRGISPVYGGSTPNASFEIVTGLPSRSRFLSGVVYQEYAELFSENSHALPLYMKKHGFKTFVFHNYEKNFWKRNIVKRKFGFDNFFAIEDMEYSGPKKWPSDKVMYDMAFDIFLKNKHDKIFFNMITVSTHGPYEEDNDFGSKNYSERMKVSVSHLVEFFDNVKKVSPDILFYIFGDHKPSLNGYYYKNGIFSDDVFSKIGEGNDGFKMIKGFDQKIIGDVPVFLYSTDKKKMGQFKNIANNYPFYCQAQMLDSVFLNSGLPAFEFTKKNVCFDVGSINYQDMVDLVPEWLYSKSLFQ